MMNLVMLATSGATTTTTTGVLTEAMTNAITQGFNSLQGTVGQVLAISVPVTVAIIALTAGVNYALRKIGGAVSRAS